MRGLLVCSYHQENIVESSPFSFICKCVKKLGYNQAFNSMSILTTLDDTNFLDPRSYWIV